MHKLHLYYWKNCDYEIIIKFETLFVSWWFTEPMLSVYCFCLNVFVQIQTRSNEETTKQAEK